MDVMRSPRPQELLMVAAGDGLLLFNGATTEGLVEKKGPVGKEVRQKTNGGII